MLGRACRRTLVTTPTPVVGEADETLPREEDQCLQPGDPPDVAVRPDDVCAMVFTSGTTSRPKGCLITHANYVYAGESVSKSLRLAPDDRHMVVLPLFHVHAQYYQTMTALIVGASLALM